MNHPRKNRNIQQHFVTAAYLAGFTIDGKRSTMLQCYERNKDRVFELIPDKVAKRRNYYSIPLRAGEWDDTADKMITGLEDQAMPILQRIIRGDYEISQFERALVAYLIAFQQLRTPWTRAMFEAMTEGQARATMTVAAKTPGFLERLLKQLQDNGESEGATADRLRSAILEERISPKAQPHSSIRPVIEVAPTIGNIYVQMRWLLLRPTGSLLFLTSDAPVVQRDPRPTVGPYGTGGLSSQTVQIWFPIARTACLVMCRDESRIANFFQLMEEGKTAEADKVHGALPPILELPIDDSTVQTVNTQTVVCADRFVYSPVRYAWIPEHLRGESQNMRMTISGLGAPKGK